MEFQYFASSTQQRQLALIYFLVVLQALALPAMLFYFSRPDLYPGLVNSKEDQTMVISELSATSDNEKPIAEHVHSRTREKKRKSRNALPLRNTSNLDETTAKQKFHECLREQFALTGSQIGVVNTSLSLMRILPGTAILLAATNMGYKYSSQWIERQRAEENPFIFIGVTSIRHGELSAHYARIPGVLAVRNCLPRAAYIVYSDIDTLVDFQAAEKIAPELTKKHPFVISFKVEHEKRVYRTNFFIVRSASEKIPRMMRKWLDNGRNVYLQDQRVFNELYDNAREFRTLVRCVFVRDLASVELCHCHSGRNQRDACMLSHSKWRNDTSSIALYCPIFRSYHRNLNRISSH